MSNKEKVLQFYKMSGNDPEQMLKTDIQVVREKYRHLRSDEMAIAFLLEEIEGGINE